MKRFDEHWDDLGQYATLHPITGDAPLLLGDGFQGGAFIVPSALTGEPMRVLVSNHEWEHVSVSLADRLPTWGEMCQIKDLFWHPGECVVQYHPALEEYVNFAVNCLHLWRPVSGELPTPPCWMIGPKSGETLDESLAEGLAALEEVTR